METQLVLEYLGSTDSVVNSAMCLLETVATGLAREATSSLETQMTDLSPSADGMIDGKTFTSTLIGALNNNWKHISHT